MCLFKLPTRPHGSCEIMEIVRISTYTHRRRVRRARDGIDALIGVIGELCCAMEDCDLIPVFFYKEHNEKIYIEGGTCNFD